MIIVYTDGACSGNPGVGGWGVVIIKDNKDEVFLNGGDDNTTNNRMELTAAIEALKNFQTEQTIKLITDSKYVKDGIQTWIKNWKKNGWKTSAKKPVKNKELWIELDELISRHNIIWEWIKGHAGNKYNEKADYLARRYIENIQIYFINFFSSSLYASERWILDKSLSTIEFELPVFLAKNVHGKFNNFEGYVELDVDNKKNNKAIFSVQIDDLDMNYIKYKDLLLSKIFFDSVQYPKAVVDTKKFSYSNEKEIQLEIELTIKGKSEKAPLIILVKRLAEELVQIQCELLFSRTTFEIGVGKWSNTSILKDKVKLKTNLFLFRE